MDETAQPSVEALLAHAGWVRALARKLALDPNDADDLVQETMAAALVARPHAGGGFKAWLAVTLKNVRRQQRRSDFARAGTEARSARAERLPSTAALAEQADLQRALVEHVLALDEPYRGVVLLRWFANLAPSDIAAQEGVPLATVTSQLTRAHQKLRERLERKHGDGSAWLSALAPLIARPDVISTVTVGGLLVNAKLVLTAATVLIVAGVLVWIRASDGEAPVSTPIASATPSAITAPHEGAGVPVADAGARAERETLARTPPPPTGSAAVLPAISRTVRGRAVDAEGRALAGLMVDWVGPPAAPVASGAHGVFELTTTASLGDIEAVDPGWATVRSGAWSASSALEPIVIGARAIDVAGVVQDESGRALADARVALVLPDGFASRFEGNLEATTTRTWSARTDDRGAFTIKRCPLIAGAVLRTVLAGYSVHEIAEPPMRTDTLVIVMQRPTIPLAGSLSGRVIDDRGSPVPSARVFLGLASSTTDEDGRFAMSLARAVSSDRISAIKAGLRPAVLERPRPARGEDTGWPAEIVLQMPGPALSIRGTVIDADGRPRADVRVWLAEPTSVGAIGKMPTFAENLMAGAVIPPPALESEARAPKHDGDTFNDFYMHDPKPSAFWHFVVSDANGRFELHGLDDRKYRLRCMDPKSLALTTTEEFRAGRDDVRVVMAAPDLLPIVAGRVRDAEGRPVAGTTVRIDGEAVGVRSRVFGGRVYVSVRTAGTSALTDAEGRFELHDVPRANIQLLVQSEQVIPTEIELSAQPDPTSVEITVHTRCTLQVQIASQELVADAVAVRDARDEPLDIFVLERGAVNAFTDVPVVEGRSAVVSTSSAAATLLLMNAGQIVKRVPIRLRSEGINRVEP